MLIIGFSWVLIGVLAALLARAVMPGRWEDSGPVAMMVACMGAFLGGAIAVLAVEGPNGYGPPTISGINYGLIGSVLGGAAAFAVYAVDVRRQHRAV